MGLREEIHKQISASLGQIAASLGQGAGDATEPEAQVAAKPEFQGGLADLIAKGGLAGIIKKFEQAGMGDLAGSWVASGENKPVNADQVHEVFGQADLGQIASKLGIPSGDISKAIAKFLPGLIDKLTPNGKLEESAVPSTTGASAGSTDL